MGVVGSGNIVPYHLEALKSVGFDSQIVLYNKNKDRAYALTESFNIPKLTDNLDEFLDVPVDAYLIASSSQSLAEIYKEVVSKKQLPILIEKPVAHNTSQIQSMFLGMDYTLVGYNRRHLASVQELKTICRNSRQGFFEVNVYEVSSGLSNSFNEDIHLLDNTVHIFDLINYLFAIDLNSLEVNSRKIERGHGLSVSARLGSIDSRFNGNLNVFFGYAGNYSLELYTKGMRARLSPLESFSLLEGMDVSEPNEVKKSRTYTPTEIRKQGLTDEEISYKPGFLRQSRDFYDLTKSWHSGERHGVKHLESASLNDSLVALSMAEWFLRQFKL